jgi:hypothetical protein
MNLATIHRPLRGYLARRYTSGNDLRVERGLDKLFGVDARVPIARSAASSSRTRPARSTC